ncbi:hypothetical protein ACF07Y_38715 [Streptomyces sp. NPDC016566]|uniref:hypothetical protein n=1 Tax=Streptomyces sp. NPDC016566 TaxID=3364967 RepID=UPI0036FA932D
MSAESSSGPAFTEVRLAGPVSDVARLVAALSGSAEIISDSASEPGKGGDVERVVHLVTHPDPRPVTAEGVSVTVQSVLEAEGGAFSALPGPAAVQEVQQAVAGALQALPQVRQVSSRVVSAWGLPSSRQ